MRRVLACTRSCGGCGYGAASAPCSPAHRPPLFPSSSSVVARQIKYEWDYLYGALSVIGGEAHFAHLPGVSLGWDLPPSTPELNPCEQLWDILKDDIANRIYENVTALRAAMKATLRRFWDDPGAVLSLIGRQWIEVQLNASHRMQVSC